ncbi:MAG: hypothetical protein ACYTGN_17220 [Planctomycetota bacterium]|jgi:hypothetical protein
MRRWIWLIVSSLAVVAIAGAPFYFAGRDAPAPAPSRAPDKTAPPTVRAETQYYVFLTMVEAAPKDEDGDGWDTGGSAPDIAYEIRWQGQVVFESTKKSNTLVAKWSTTTLEAGDVLKGISIDDAIKAARVTVRPREELEFVVYDRDVAGDDLIGKWTVLTDALKLGDQAWKKPGGGVVSAICRVLPIDNVAFEELTK